jgi:hypothetical protein
MEDTSVLDNPVFNNDNIYNTGYDLGKSSGENSTFSTPDPSLTAEGAKNLFHYLKSYNLFKEPDMLVISSNRHYYYDENDLKNVRTLVILKKLNRIKDRDTFLQTLYRMLPPNINFIGCFSNSETPKGNSFLSKLSGRFNNLLDSRTDHYIKKKYVSVLLEKYGFSIIDMTEINGLTYFYSRNSRYNVERRA